MTHKIYNLIIMLITAIITVIAHFYGINSIYLFGYIAFPYIIIYIIINSILKEKLKTFILYPLLGLFITFGVINVTNTAIELTSYLIKLPANIEAIELIKNNTKHKNLFEYEGTSFYIDENEENLIQIDESSKYYGSVIIPIYKEDDLSEEMINKMNLFTSFETNSLLKNNSDYTLSYGFIENEKVPYITIRILKDNEILYTYFTPDDINKFLSNSKLFKEYNSIGDLSIYSVASLVKKEISNDKTELENNISETTNDNEYISKIIITENNEYFFSDLLFVEYEQDYPYRERINNFLNKEALDNLQTFKEANKTTNEAGEVTNSIEELSEEQQSELQSILLNIKDYFVYLAEEKQIDENNIIRFYSAMNSSSEEEISLTNINIIEIETKDQYLIFKTNSNINSLYSILFD